MSYHWSFHRIYPERSGAFILLLIGGAMGLIEPRRMAIGLFR